MPFISSTVAEKKKLLKAPIHTRSVDLNDISANKQETSHVNFLKIGPAIPADERKKLGKRSNTSLNFGALNKTPESPYLYDSVNFKTDQNGSVVITRTQKQKEKDPDRITLDRRGLVNIPVIEGEERLRLLSLQHNLITNLDHLKCQSFPYLVFLDLYDNQLEKVCGLENIENLRVILMGKNRSYKHYLTPKATSPGPATYTPTDPSTYRQKNPLYTMRPYLDPPVSKSITPGPKYYPKLWEKPGYSFGLRVENMPYITAADDVPCA